MTSVIGFIRAVHQSYLIAQNMPQARKLMASGPNPAHGVVFKAILYVWKMHMWPTKFSIWLLNESLNSNFFQCFPKLGLFRKSFCDSTLESPVCHNWRRHPSLVVQMEDRQIQVKKCATDMFDKYVWQICLTKIWLTNLINKCGWQYYQKNNY